MLDFIGIIPLKGQPIGDIHNPFRHWQKFEEVKFDLEHFKFGDFSFLRRTQEGLQDIGYDDHLCVLQHGDCYTKIFDSTFAEKKKLTAPDLITLYRQYGEKFINHIKGSFALIVLDRKNKSVQVFNDPLNLRSVFYISTPTEFILASSLSALVNYLSQSGKTPQIDSRAVMDRILFDFILDDHTYIQDIREIPAGSILALSGKSVSVSQYFDSFSYFDLSGPTLNRKEGAVQLQDVLAKNISLYNEGACQTAIALTGGFDSRSIAALFGKELELYKLYSYGKEGSWDLKIPQMIAERLNLNYQPIFLDESYEKEFSHFAKLAVLAGDGVTEFSQANIAYVYTRFLKDKRSILTGLFGSELIKTPSSRGLFIDEHIIELLNTKDLASSVKGMLANCKEKGIDLEDRTEELIDMIENHPYINNDLPPNEKYFHYLLMVGARKYFSKEVKIQKVLKNNLHPFFDLEFIDTLLKTPFPWVHNFSRKKSLVKNVSIHQLYGSIIHSNPQLSDIISTHGFRPRYLLNKLHLPLLAMEYWIYKKKISRSSQLNFQMDLALNHILKNKKKIFESPSMILGKIYKMKASDRKNFIKLSSLQYWYKSLGLSF